ncbi:hypothetical protein JKP88DRAFT_317572 [Tribonema minus]|uniref:Uncharacterized protein n=1 Tax=Tribonema minus TaxID=303371 RepID=A0A836CF01_9STRA|nr:hypothetical protein JKP88DRAFT_317572 [Tribonema minus]
MGLDPMVSSAFFGVTSVTASLTLCFFAERTLVMRKRNAITVTALAAAFLSSLNTVWQLAYFHLGKMTDLSICKIGYAWGIMRTTSSALAFLHLFLRANAANALNPRWPRWRAFGALLLLANVLLLVLVPSLWLLTPKRYDTGVRCVVIFPPVTFLLMWAAQLASHVVFAGLFVWPLLSHVRAMRGTGLARRQGGGGDGGEGGGRRAEMTVARKGTGLARRQGGGGDGGGRGLRAARGAAGTAYTPLLSHVRAMRGTGLARRQGGGGDGGEGGGRRAEMTVARKGTGLARRQGGGGDGGEGGGRRVEMTIARKGTGLARRQGGGGDGGEGGGRRAEMTVARKGAAGTAGTGLARRQGGGGDGGEGGRRAEMTVARKGSRVYHTLIYRAILAMAFSVSFTLACSVVAVLVQAGVIYQPYTLGLSILDNGVTLLSLCVANSGGTGGDAGGGGNVLPTYAAPRQTSVTSISSLEAQSWSSSARQRVSSSSHGGGGRPPLASVRDCSDPRQSPQQVMELQVMESQVMES